MIPLQLSLINFLSYREAILDFRGLHTACICGSNGAGKSSLLEAITWAIWGQSRAATDDDVINAGAQNVRVDFTFVNNQQTYRVIRSRQRGKSSAVEFQIETEVDKFRSISGKGLRATQHQIVTTLKLDYDTFINSSYLRQGRADEFMLRRPNERKQILADLLKLDQYEQLAVQAKDASKQFKGQTQQLEQSIEPLQQQLEQKESIKQAQVELVKELKKLQSKQEIERQKLQQLQAKEQQRQTWQQQITWQQTQYQNLSQDCIRLGEDCQSLKTQLQDVNQILSKASEIQGGYEKLQLLRQEEEILAGKFTASQDAQQQKRELEQQLNQQVNELNVQIRQTQTRLENLEQQEQEIEQIISRGKEIAAALEKLHSHRQRLQKLDQLQLQVSPLLQRHHTLQTELEKKQAQLTARWEQLKNSAQEIAAQVEQVPQVRSSAVAVESEIGELEKKRVRQQRVLEKGQERRTFQEKLQERQRTCERQVGELQQKLAMLHRQDAICPLCERELDEHYHQRVVSKTETEQQDIQEEFWIIREQIAVCESELQVLRGEYAQLSKELAGYDTLMLQKGQLEAQLEASLDKYERLEAIKVETENLERALAAGNYALELQTELQVLNQELAQLNYDEQTHALVRGDVERWRWAEIKQAKIEEANRRQERINRQKPDILVQIESLQQSITQLQQNSSLQQQIRAVEQRIATLNYNRSYHQEVTTALRQAQDWQLHYQQLQQAQEQKPPLQSRIDELELALQERYQAQAAMQKQLATMVAQMEQVTDYSQEIATLEGQIHQRRRHLDDLLAQQGSLTQQLNYLDNLQSQYQDNCERLQKLRQQCRVYQELAQAFGKNGIQALMIENVLPQLEAQTNQILSRLTGNQLHVQFLTQKAGRSKRSRKQESKLIDTLDILIADAQGTRPYETYSGGEAFRINFAIRLALARLLAQRSGTSLQMLIIDEGFGTQDAQGCDRLVAAINAISADFSCILTVTHMPQFKEAFQTRIEVLKTNQGSQLRLSN